MSSARARPGLHPDSLGGAVRRTVARHRRRVVASLVAVAAAGLPSPVAASSGGGRRITDAENTRTVYLVVVALVGLAIGLALFTWRFWRSTRREHEALAPLEVMSDRKFVASDPVARQALLDVNRPVGAAPLAPGAPEPLLIPADEEETVTADDAPATLVLAAVGAGAAASADGDATTVVAAQPSESTESTEAATAESIAGAEPATAVLVAVDGNGERDEPRDGPTVEPDVTMVTVGSAPVPIDPGLHVEPPDDPAPQLSLADLVALNADTPVHFDEDELASTPSTGIPIIESAEAWVQRQLIVSNGETEHADPDPELDQAVEDEVDSDEASAAAVRGAE